MSHQIRLLLSRGDVMEWLDSIGLGREVELFPYQFSAASPAPLTRQEFLKTPPGSTAVLVPKGFSGDLVTIQSGSNSAVDLQKSPAMELWGSPFDGKTLSPGRLYYTDQFLLSDGSRREKDPSFLTWAKSTFQSLKKHFPKRHGAFVLGPEASTWMTPGPG